MSLRPTHQQLAARDAQGERHMIMVTRSAIPGHAHLQGPPHFTWHDGQALHLVDAKAGVLESAADGVRLTIEDWRG